MQKTGLLIAITVLMACQTNNNEKNQELEDMDAKTEIIVKDHHSFSRPDEAVVTHLDWKADIDFDKKIIRASAKYSIENKKGVDTIYLDSRNLIIHGIYRDDSPAPIEFTAVEHEEYLGTELRIPIHSQNKSITIIYETSAGAAALQFLHPVQTAGKKHPFLFTQSQAILARTWIPCQDSPGIRFTYSADVKVPEGMMAVMSAANPTEVSEGGVYHFEMDQPVPSYLMALAAGNLVYKSIGAVTGVYAEPELIDAAVFEFEDMQNMVDTAESLYGPYQWGKYDVIVLPPSFPFGGMENPRLTFATPTIIAGDKSLTALIAHELAHSWSGNLVTNATWDDIWLNEGFTVYFENRIMEEIFGADFANMLALLSYQDLQDEIEWLKSEDRLADTRLRVDLEGRNPDDGLTGIPYDKGFYLLKLIEQTVGRENFDAFLKEYFSSFAFQVMTTDAFVDYIQKELLSKNPDWGKQIRLEDWIFGTGLPDNCPIIESDRFKKVEAELKLWESGSSAKELASQNWRTPEWLHFVRSLPAKMSDEQMSDLDAAFGFTTSGNSEIQSAWFEKVIPNNYEVAKPEVEAFLIRVGRRKFLVPLYKAILSTEKGKDWAKDIYTKARPNYHAVSTETLDALIG